MENNNKNDDRNYSWGSFLIFIGIVLLLNTLDVLPWNVWTEIIKFWPLFLIIGGLSIIFELNRLLSWVFGIITLLMYLVVIFFLITKNNSGSFDKYDIKIPQWISNITQKFSNSNDNGLIESTYSIPQKYKYYKNYDISLKIAASTFEMKDNEDTLNLQLFSKYNKKFGKPLILLDKKHDLLFFDFEQKDDDFGNYNFSTKSPSYNLYFNNDSFIENLSLKVGAGKTVIDLSDAKIKDIEAEIGAGELDIELSNISDNSSFDIKVGTGDVSLKIPEEVGFRIHYTLGLGDIDVSGAGIDKFIGKGIYESPNYDSTDTNIDINVEVGLGKFTLSEF